MIDMTMTMNASRCDAVARPRSANVRLAAARVPVQGTVLSIVTPAGLARIADLPFTGLVSIVADVDVATAYKTTDVARSRFGRPPV